jgi:hypothetical protein
MPVIPNKRIKTHTEIENLFIIPPTYFVDVDCYCSMDDWLAIIRFPLITTFLARYRRTGKNPGQEEGKLELPSAYVKICSLPKRPELTFSHQTL